MEKDFFIVIGRFERDGEVREFEESIHTDYQKAYNQLMANGMSFGGVDWRIERYYGRFVSVMDK